MTDLQRRIAARIAARQPVGGVALAARHVVGDASPARGPEAAIRCGFDARTATRDQQGGAQPLAAAVHSPWNRPGLVEKEAAARFESPGVRSSEQPGAGLIVVTPTSYGPFDASMASRRAVQEIGAAPLASAVATQRVAST